MTENKETKTPEEMTQLIVEKYGASVTLINQILYRMSGNQAMADSSSQLIYSMLVESYQQGVVDEMKRQLENLPNFQNRILEALRG